MATRFNPINQPSRTKRKEIPEELWERYKKPILQELKNGNGVEKVVGWINDQKFPDFSPRYVVIKKEFANVVDVPIHEALNFGVDWTH
jgi:hypothetical protein